MGIFLLRVRYFFGLLVLGFCTAMSSCSKADISDCRLRYSSWSLGGGWYPPRPDGPGRLQKPWLYEVAFAGSQNEPGGINSSSFKLLKLHIVNSDGEKLDVSDCIIINSQDVGVETTWHTKDGNISMDSRPISVDFKFIDLGENREIKTISYPLPE